MKLLVSVGVPALLLALAGGCRGGNSVAIAIDGSSTVYPITEAVAEAFRGVRPDLRVTVGISGTGGGFKKFCAGETDLSDASRPIKAAEIDACAKHNVQSVEVPIAYDGIAIVVNPANTWCSDITKDELKKLWAPEAQKTVLRWNQVRPSWPDKEIHLFGAGVDSGTYDYFTEAVVGKEHSSRGDYTSSEDDNVLVQGIAGDPNALGFFGLAYYEENKAKLKLVPVDDGKPDNGAGPIAPSAQTVRDGTYQPLSRPLFLYVSLQSLQRKEVTEFVQFYLQKAPDLVAKVGYIPLPNAAYPWGQKRIDAKSTAPLFGGKASQVGLTIEKLMAAEQ